MAAAVQGAPVVALAADGAPTFAVPSGRPVLRVAGRPIVPLAFWATLSGVRRPPGNRGQRPL